MRKSSVAELALWGAHLARLSMRPRTFKVSRGSGGNKDQENARRRLRQKIYGTATGGGPIWTS